MLGLHCPYCFSDNLEVQNTERRISYIHRARRCQDCNQLFRTREEIEVERVRDQQFDRIDDFVWGA